MMATRVTASLMAATFIAGCGGDGPPDSGSPVAGAEPSASLAAAIPTDEAIGVFRYGAMAERNPFEPYADLQGARSSGAPDPSRRRQPQERFPLGQLEMVGTLAGRGKAVALIRDPEGTTHPLAVGDYLGRDHGRITKIRETGVDLVELIEDDKGGWKLRPRTVDLSVPANTDDHTANHEGDDET